MRRDPEPLPGALGIGHQPLQAAAGRKFLTWARFSTEGGCPVELFPARRLACWRLWRAPKPGVCRRARASGCSRALPGGPAGDLVCVRVSQALGSLEVFCDAPVAADRVNQYRYQLRVRVRRRADEPGTEFPPRRETHLTCRNMVQDTDPARAAALPDPCKVTR
jgi:hypothetical protein